MAYPWRVVTPEKQPGSHSKNPAKGMAAVRDHVSFLGKHSFLALSAQDGRGVNFVKRREHSV